MMSYRSCIVLSGLFALIIAVTVSGIEAKRGCAAFGHSCYGGMGKRALDILNNNGEVAQDIQTDENPAFVFTGPRSGYVPAKPSNSASWLNRENNENLSRIVSRMIQRYKQLQEQEMQNNI